MASAPAGDSAVFGRVDHLGRLIAADPPLARLQEEAGALVGELFAVPQLAAIARLAATLNVPVERPAIAVTEDGDYDLWVGAIPADDEVRLSIEGWTRRSPAAPRLSGMPAPEPGTAVGTAEVAPDLSWSADGDLRLTEIGSGLAQALAVEPADVVGMPLTKLFQLVEGDDGEMPLLQALAGHRAFTGQRAATRTEPRIELVIDAEAISGSGGRFGGYRGQAVQSGGPEPAASSDESAGPGLETVLRAPLESIIADAERIVERSDGPLRSDYASYGNDIAAAARHLSQVIEAIGHDPEYGHGRIDLGALSAEAIMLVEPAAQERGVRIDIDEAGALPTRGEEHAVIQILVNLIGNAVRHSPAGTRVTLSFARDERTVAVTVRDQGQGIAEADQQRIFERFERADEEPGGTGLGLAISRRLARSMGGEVSLVSGPGEGASFTLSLPVD